jgi:hypothetical protein
MHNTTNIKIYTPCNNKLSQMKSPNTFLVSTLTSAISIHPHCPDSDGITFPQPNLNHTVSLPLLNHNYTQVHKERGVSDSATTGCRLQATAK